MALQQLAGRVAHEIKNPLNAVAVNLEVVRSRSERERIESNAILPFARAAAQELERTSRLVEALLAVARPARPDLVEIATPLVTLYDALAGAEGGSVEMDRMIDDAGIDVAPDDARLALASTLDRMVGPGVNVRIRITSAGNEVAAEIAGPSVTTNLSSRVRMASRPAGPTLFFPRASARN
jgi:signal transduction histidine kinase